MENYMSVKLKAVMLGLVLTAAGFTNGVWRTGADPAEAAESLALSCSAQVYEVLKGETLAVFTQKTGIKVQASVSTSDAAVSRLTLGLSDAAAVAGRLTLRCRSLGYLEHAFCRDALVVIGNAQVGVSNLSLNQLRDVFSGAVTNWSQLGGPDRPIRVIIPSRDSAAYRNFSRMVMGGLDMAYYAIAHRSTAAGDLARCVPWAVSFVNLAATRGRPKGIRIIKIEGLSPKDEEYPFLESFSLVTKGKPGKPVQELLEFLGSNEAARILLNRGVTPCSGYGQGVVLRPGRSAPPPASSSAQ